MLTHIHIRDLVIVDELELPIAEGMTALKRLGEPEDFRGVGVFLASNASAYMTGQAVTVCGGANMWT